MNSYAGIERVKTIPPEYQIITDEDIVRIKHGKDFYFIFEDQLKKNFEPYTSLVMAPVSLLEFISNSTSKNLSAAREIARKLLKK